MYFRVYFRGKSKAPVLRYAPTAVLAGSAQEIAPTSITDDDYQIAFTNTSGTYTVTFRENTTCDVLIVGGGASGGLSIGGGGGGGGVVYIVSKVFTGGVPYTIRVGAGAVAPGSTALGSGVRGEDSYIVGPDGMDVTFDSIALRGLGGGYGGSYNDNLNNSVNMPGQSGGSGGGASDNNADVNYLGGGSTQGLTYWDSGTSTYIAGGAAGRSSQVGQYFGSGGGGMGVHGTTYKDGASGIINNITGVEVTYASGGGGGTNTSTSAGVGGVAGGRGGGAGAGFQVATSGVNGTGSGGGGGGYVYPEGGSYAPGSGGTGIVVVRFKLPLHALTVQNSGPPLTNWVQSVVIPWRQQYASDFSDLRFVDRATGIILDHYYDYILPQTRAIVFLLVPVFADGAIIDVMYGQSTLTNGDPTKVFPFYDDFTNDTGMWVTHGNTSISAGALRVTATTPMSFARTAQKHSEIATSTFAGMTYLGNDLTVETRLSADSGGCIPEMAIRTTPASTGPAAGIKVRIDCRTVALTGRGILLNNPLITEFGNWVQIHAGNATQHTINTQDVLRFTAVGNTFKSFLNGTQLGTTYTSTAASYNSDGVIGVANHNLGTVSHDWVRAYRASAAITRMYFPNSAAAVLVLSNNGPALSNWTANVTLQYRDAYANNFQDLRFVDVATNTTVPHFLENVTNGVSAVVWLRTPTFSDGRIIEVRTGFPLTMGVASDVFPFYDNFPGSTLDTTKWNTNGVSVSVSNNQMIFGGTGYAYIATNATQSQMGISKDVAIEACILSTSTSAIPELAIRSVVSTTTTHNGIKGRMDCRGGIDMGRGAILSNPFYNWVKITSPDSTAMSINTQHVFKFVGQNNTFTNFLNGVQMSSSYTSTNVAYNTDGVLGVMNHNGAEMRVYWVRAYGVTSQSISMVVE